MLICCRTVAELGLTSTEIGKRLAIGQQFVSKWVKQQRAYCSSEEVSLYDLIH